MTVTRRKQIRRQILLILDQSNPYLLAEPILLDNLSLVLKPSPTLSEMEEVLKLLESDRAIVRMRTDEAKAKITDEGKAELLT
jgi:hypothetical protein